MPEEGGPESGAEVVHPPLVCFLPESCEDMSRLTREQFPDDDTVSAEQIPDADIIDLILHRKRAIDL